MALISHMLLSTFWCFKLFVTIKAKFTELDALGEICQKAFKIDKTLYFQNYEVVFIPHVVQIFLYTWALFITEETDTKWLERSFFRLSLASGKIAILRNGQRFVTAIDRLVDITQEIWAFCCNWLKDAALWEIRVGLKVSFGWLLVLFGALMLHKGLASLKCFSTWITFPARFSRNTHNRILKQHLLLFKDLFGNRLQLSHLSLCVVHMEFGRTMKFERRYVSELETTCSANNLFWTILFAL